MENEISNVLRIVHDGPPSSFLSKVTRDATVHRGLFRQASWAGNLYGLTTAPMCGRANEAPRRIFRGFWKNLVAPEERCRVARILVIDLILDHGHCPSVEHVEHVEGEQPIDAPHPQCPIHVQVEAKQLVERPAAALFEKHLGAGNGTKECRFQERSSW